jgi:hypothetical protein
LSKRWNFSGQAEALFTAPELAELVEFVAYHPTAGSLIPGTGGVRKLRWAAGGKGKRGGACLIYLFHDEHMPIFLYTVYSKAARDDLTAAERNLLRKIVRETVSYYGSEFDE